MKYPSSYYDINPIHDSVHLQQMRDIAQEKIDEEVPRICKEICYSIMQSAFNNALNGISIDVNRIVEITCKELNAQFHSEEVSHFIADTLKTELIKGLSAIDPKLIVK